MTTAPPSSPTKAAAFRTGGESIPGTYDRLIKRAVPWPGRHTKPDAAETVANLLEDTSPPPFIAGRSDVDAYLRERRVDVVVHDRWLRIDAEDTDGPVGPG